MAHTKQVKAAAVLNNAFDSSVTGGDGKELCATDHPLINGGTFANEPSTAADLNETSLEDALISIAGFVDERGLKIALRGTKLIIPRQLQFTAERLMSSVLRSATSDNDVNAIRSMGMLPQGYTVNDFLTDTDAFFIMTDTPRGFLHFERTPLSTNMEADLIQATCVIRLVRDIPSVSQILDVCSGHLEPRLHVLPPNFKGRVKSPFIFV